MDDSTRGQGPETTNGAPPGERAGGVTLEAFAAMSRQLASGSDLAHTLADGHLTLDQWEDAVQAWTDRIRMETAVARRFNHLYTHVADEPTPSS